MKHNYTTLTEIRNRRKFGISGITAVAIIVVIIAAAAIAAYAAFGMGGGGTSTSSQFTSTPTNSSSSLNTTTSHSLNTTTATSSAQIGALSILVSDPPHLPANVTALFITYSNMFVHIAGLPGSDGWVQVSSAGTIQLLGTINIGQTVATASIPTGDYNMMRFNVSSAVVTFNNQNYSATVQRGNLTIHFFSNLTIDASAPSAIVVDVSPFVFNYGTTANPAFVVKPTAVTYIVPKLSVTHEMQQVGNRYQFFENNTWFWTFRHAYSQDINITSVTLNGSSLDLSIANLSNRTITIYSISITELHASTSTGHGNYSGMGVGPANSSTMPNSMTGSAVFLVLPNGTLSQLTRTQSSGTPLNISNLIWNGTGYDIAKGVTTLLSYNGSIALALRMSPNVQPGTIVAGQQYLVSIVGDLFCANYVVVASS